MHQPGSRRYEYGVVSKWAYPQIATQLDFPGEHDDIPRPKLRWGMRRVGSSGPKMVDQGRMGLQWWFHGDVQSKIVIYWWFYQPELWFNEIYSDIVIFLYLMEILWVYIPLGRTWQAGKSPIPLWRVPVPIDGVKFELSLLMAPLLSRLVPNDNFHPDMRGIVFV